MKKILSFLFAALLVGAVQADTCVIGGVKYIYSVTSDNTATLVGCGDESISGELVIPPFLDGGYVVTKIAAGAFAGRTKLTSVVFPDAMQDMYWYELKSVEIESRAFEGCTGLTSVTFSTYVKYIGSRAFEGCTGLRSVTFLGESSTSTSYDTSDTSTSCDDDSPGTSIRIDSEAFEGCTSLVSLTFPMYVSEIGERAFAGCTGLRSLTFLERVGCIREEAFEGCTGLVQMNFKEEDYDYGYNKVGSICARAFKGCTGLVSLTLSDVNDLQEGAFEGCTGLISLTLSDVNYLGEGAFKGCTGLTSLTISDVNYYLGEGAFEGCTGLVSLTISDVGYIDRRAFADCSRLTSLTFSGRTWYSDSSDGRSGYIYGEAFAGCTGLIEVKVLGDYVEIGERAFAGCTKLMSLSFSCRTDEDETCRTDGDGNSVSVSTRVSIRSYAFDGCVSLTAITFPGEASIGEYAFNGCTELVEVKVSGDSDSVYIGERAFAGCTKLTSITFSSWSHIGEYAFNGCANLTSMTFPDGAWIGEYAFNGCSNLEYIVFGGSPDCDENPCFGACQVGYYPTTYTNEWKDVIDENGKWNGLTMISYEGDYPIIYKDVKGADNSLNPTGYGGESGCYYQEFVALTNVPGYTFAYWTPSKIRAENLTGPLVVTAHWFARPEPFPEVEMEEKIAAVFEEAKDARLAEKITTVEKYEKFQTWVEKVAGDDVMARQAVKDSEWAWFAYALDLGALPEVAPTNVVIDTIEVSSTKGWSLSLSVGDGLKIGSAAEAEDLGTVFVVEGAAELKEESFSAGNVTATLSAAEDGKLAVQITPVEGDKQFFVRVKMTP